jgi:hypothetical protein
MSTLAREGLFRMKSLWKYLGSALLMVAMFAPLRLAAQDRDQDHDRDHKQVRVYDKDHHQYRTWDDNEDRAYRQWVGERHLKYREYNHINAKQQREYWEWREQHHGDQDRDHDHH